jgi:hypothetical protein
MKHFSSSTHWEVLPSYVSDGNGQNKAATSKEIAEEATSWGLTDWPWLKG